MKKLIQNYKIRFHLKNQKSLDVFSFFYHNFILYVILIKNSYIIILINDFILNYTRAHIIKSIAVFTKLVVFAVASSTTIDNINYVTIGIAIVIAIETNSFIDFSLGSSCTTNTIVWSFTIDEKAIIWVNLVSKYHAFAFKPSFIVVGVSCITITSAISFVD